MAITEIHSAAPFGAITVHHIVSAVMDAPAALRAWIGRRRTVAALSRLSANQLDDIGLTPADIAAFRRTGL